MPGDGPQSAPPPRSRSITILPHGRKFSNFLIDKKLQLRYILAVSALSIVIATALGYMLYRQEHRASGFVLDNLRSFLQSQDDSATLRAAMEDSLASQMASEDRALLLRMIGICVGLFVVQGGFLLIMTHRVAGPLHKIALYFDRMGRGKMGEITDLRKGDMLQKFFADFRGMHDTARGRLRRDADVMQELVDIAQSDTSANLKALPAVEELAAHVDERKDRLM